MGIPHAVEWWEQWQLRILVLASLFVQWMLFLSAGLRKLAIPPLFRSTIWLAYLGSDALAIYGLATLFSRQSREDCMSGKGNSILEVLWAPVLLMHLGGQDGITAYNIKDNELWTRHVVTAVSQVTEAIYVFCKSWPGGDKKLLQAAILFFVPGVLKCIEKPWALKSASINSLVSPSSPAPMGFANGEGGGVYSLEDYVQKARAFFRINTHHQAQQGDSVDLEADSHLPDQAPRKDDAVDLEPNLEPQTSGTRRSRWNQEMEDYNVDLQAYKLFVDLMEATPWRRLGVRAVGDGKASTSPSIPAKGVAKASRVVALASKSPP